MGKTWEKNPFYDVKYQPGKSDKVGAPEAPRTPKRVPGRGSKPIPGLHAAEAGKSRGVSPTNLVRTPAKADTVISRRSHEE